MSWVLASLTAVATLYSAAADFTGMTDLEALMHDDRSAALAEFQRRAKDYPKEKVREIEQAYFKLRMTPQKRADPGAEALLAEINRAEDGLKRMDLFSALYERYEDADDAGKAKIRDGFLAAWAKVPYTAYDENVNDNWSRYRDYARQAGRYFPTEEALIPVLVERCLNVNAPDRHEPFISQLSRADVKLGPLAAEHAEQLYGGLINGRSNYFLSSSQSTMNTQLLRILGRSGKPGLDALLRLGKENSEAGIWALGWNRTAESEAILWDMYESTAANKDRRRLQILRELAKKSGTLEEKASRRERIRRELVPYLQLPVGNVNARDIEHAVALAKDTKDPYYLPHVEALEDAFFELDRSEIQYPGMEGRMDEALANLREHFSEARARLEQVAAAGAHDE